MRKHRTWNLEILGLVPTYHPGMTSVRILYSICTRAKPKCVLDNAQSHLAAERHQRLRMELHPANRQCLVLDRHRDTMPDVLDVTASTEDGVAMAIEHKTLPVGGVQFHPESLMSLGGEVGLRIVENAFRLGAAVN